MSRPATQMEIALAIAAAHETSLLRLGAAAESVRFSKRLPGPIQASCEANLRMAELDARACGAFETSIDRSIAAGWQDLARGGLVGAWGVLRKIELVKEVSPRALDDVSGDPIERAEQLIADAIALCQEWGLDPDDEIRRCDSEGKL